jgi:hypothetical protein
MSSVPSKTPLAGSTISAVTDQNRTPRPYNYRLTRLDETSLKQKHCCVRSITEIYKTSIQNIAKNPQRLFLTKSILGAWSVKSIYTTSVALSMLDPSVPPSAMASIALGISSFWALSSIPYCIGLRGDYLRTRDLVHGLPKEMNEAKNKWIESLKTRCKDLPLDSDTLDARLLLYLQDPSKSSGVLDLSELNIDRLPDEFSRPDCLVHVKELILTGNPLLYNPKKINDLLSTASELGLLKVHYKDGL